MRGAPAYWIAVLAVAGLVAACSSDEDESTPGSNGGAAGTAGASGGGAGTAGQAGSANGGSSNGGSSNGGSSNGGSSNGGSSNGGSAGTAGAAGAGGALPATAKIHFLHHSTGGVIWGGGVSDWFTQYNTAHSTQYEITETAFPSGDPYPWENYPYDYWNIWIKNAGGQPYMQEPTLELLTTQYDVIVFKHCFPVSGVEADTGNPDITSNVKSAENYKLQYAALKDKLHQFPSNRFVVWTGAALREQETNPDQAARAKGFFDWVKTTWDEKGDNIFVWDFWQLETDGGLYLTSANASADSHPNDTFAKKAAPLFAQRVVDVLEGRGDTGSLTGE